MTTAWLLPGGASLGAVQAGQAEALLAGGVAPDFLIGASAGSLNAAWLAAEASVASATALQALWRGLRRRDIFPWSPRVLGAGLAGRRDHVVSPAPLAGWVASHLRFRRFEDAAVPLEVTATDLATGAGVFLASGPVLPALLASAALPGVFPPVSLDGRLLVDGGMVADVPVGRAVQRGADRVYILRTLGPEPAGRPRGARDVLQRTINLLVANARHQEVAAWADQCEVYVVPAPYIPGISPVSFKRVAELIDAARALTTAWLPTARPEPVPARRP